MSLLAGVLGHHVVTVNRLCAERDAARKELADLRAGIEVLCIQAEAHPFGYDLVTATSLRALLSPATESPVVGAAGPHRTGEQSGSVQGDAATSSLDYSSTTGPLTDRVAPFTLTEEHEPAPRLTDAEYMVERRFRLAPDALDES